MLDAAGHRNRYLLGCLLMWGGVLCALLATLLPEAGPATPWLLGAALAGAASGALLRRRHCPRRRPGESCGIRPPPRQ
ncbi:MAG TPA: hypothetical protein VIX81_06600 [Gammaproteobacteria bacterium]